MLSNSSRSLGKGMTFLMDDVLFVGSKWDTLQLEELGKIGEISTLFKN